MISDILENVFEKHGQKVATFLDDALDCASKKVYDKMACVLESLLFMFKVLMGLLMVQTLTLVCMLCVTIH